VRSAISLDSDAVHEPPICVAALVVPRVRLYALLIVAWLTDATKTTRGTLNGRLFLPAPASARSNS
jgi:hypothetical protein